MGLSGFLATESYFRPTVHAASSQAWDPKFNVPSELRRGELQGEASKVTRTEFDGSLDRA